MGVDEKSVVQSMQHGQKICCTTMWHRERITEQARTKPHGQITRSWGEILDTLQSKGHFKRSSMTTIQNKVNALIVWQKVLSAFLRHLCLPTYHVRIQTPWKVRMVPAQ